MRLWIETNSLANNLLSRAVIGEPEPVVGMGVTFLRWTDREPGTIYGVFKAGKSTFITVAADDAKRIDKNGMSECQEYEYTPRPDGYKSVFRKNLKNGRWERVTKNQSGRWVKAGGEGLRIGEREKYYDFSF